MDNNNRRCPQCGGQMAQVGSEPHAVIYHCRSCGYDAYVQLSPDDNTEYLHKRSMLLGRVRQGIIDWELTPWDSLRRDIIDFTAAFHAARNDIHFQMAVIACLTKGFHDLDKERYKECKHIFKVTEKVYKRYVKNPSVIPPEMGDTGPMEYEEYRRMYKGCKNEFLGQKVAYKVLFKLGGKLVPIPRI